MHTQPSASFGVLLRHYRQRAGLTQEALATHAGLTVNAISALERGERRHPYPHTVKAIATALALESDQHDLLLRLARTKTRTLPTMPPTDVPALLQTITDSRASRSPAAALPVAANPLLGRETEYAAVLEALTSPPCRVVTLVGPGGVGKTRLALQIATDLAQHVAAQVVWVPLAPVATADLVGIAVANALQCPIHGGDTVTAQILEFVRGRDVLLVLDNMEHVLAAADFVTVVLAHAPQVRVLATSRERLRIAGEWVIDLHGLALPDMTVTEEPTATPAVRLFEERARQVAQHFVVTPRIRVDVARVCALVEGMPLGIELAAAWIRTLTPAEIADEITRNLDFLQRADRDAPARHRSLRAVFDHSWNLLSPEERDVLARLAVFRGGCDRRAAEEVASASLSVLAALVDKSLVRRVVDAMEPTRYDLHELLRQYALAKLASDPATEAATRARHAAYYARQLGDRTGAFLNGAAPVALAEVAADLENIRQAWAHAVVQRDHPALDQMAHSMQVICEICGLFEEGVTLFREAATALNAAYADAIASGRAPDPDLVWTLGHILSLYGNRAARCGHFGEARDLLHEAYGLLEARPDLLLRSGTLAWLGYMTYVLGSYHEARAWLTRSIALSRTHGDTFFLARSESILALVAQAQGVADEACTLAQAGVNDWRANGHPCSLAMGLWVQSHVLLTQGTVAEAAASAREGLHLAVWLQDPWATGAALLQLGLIALAQEDPSAARHLVEQSVATFSEIGDPWSRGRALIALGWVAEAQGRIDEAYLHFGTALRVARATGLDPLALEAQYGEAYVMHHDAPAAAAALLDPIIAHRAVEHPTRQRALVLRSALRSAGRMPGAAYAAVAPGQRTTAETLTSRELEVLSLLGQGCSNQVIAQELIVAVGTVKRHVNSILGKLAAQSRLEAVAHARERGLL